MRKDLGTPLGRAFYQRPVLQVARGCIGKLLVHDSREGVTAGRIVEAEAYRGPLDRAAHSHGGRRTARTEAMWGEAGHAYMFLLYGMHWAFNLVTGAVGEPHAVLIRAVEPWGDAGLMARRRNMDAARVALCNGPGKLCAAYGLDKRHYGTDLCGSQLFLTEVDHPRGAIGRSPRINVDYAGSWAQKLWRYYERGNRHVSVKPRD